MRLAVLVTNTDDSAFARERPLDDAKFADLVHLVCPKWEVVPFWVCRGEFPESIDEFQGVMITGSPASTLDGALWIAELEALVRRIIAAHIPVFGACFGHQIIAKALGAGIRQNPEGWAHGLIDVRRVGTVDWSGDSDILRLYGSHIEQVVALPEGAVRLFESPGCPIAGFAIGSHVFTVQHHPEMSRAFMSDLVEEYADEVGPAVTDAARASIRAQPADNQAFAEELVAFFEAGRR